MGRPDTGGSPANGCGAFSSVELYELAEGKFSRDREAVYRDHLAVCSSCQRAYEEFERVRQGVQADIEVTALAAPVDLAARVRRVAVGERKATPQPLRAARPLQRSKKPRSAEESGLRWTLAAAAVVIVGLVGLLLHYAGEQRKQAPVVKRESPKAPVPPKSPDGTRVVVNPPERPPERPPDRPPERPPDRPPERPPEQGPEQPPERPPEEPPREPVEPEKPGPTVVVQAEPVPLDTCAGPLEVVHEDGKREVAASGTRVSRTDVLAAGNRPALFTLRGGEELTMASNSKVRVETREGRVLASIDGRGEVFVATGPKPQFAMVLEGREFSGEHARFLVRNAGTRVDVAVYEGEVRYGADGVVKAGQGSTASKGAWGTASQLQDPRPPAWAADLGGGLRVVFREDFEKALPEGWLGERVVNAKPLGRGGAFAATWGEDGFGLDTPIWEKPIAYCKGTRVSLRYFANQDTKFEVMVMNRTIQDNYGFVVERPAKGRWTTISIDLQRTGPHEPGGRGWQDGDAIDSIRLRCVDADTKCELWVDDMTLLVPK